MVLLLTFVWVMLMFAIIGVMVNRKENLLDDPILQFLILHLFLLGLNLRASLLLFPLGPRFRLLGQFFFQIAHLRRGWSVRSRV